MEKMTREEIEAAIEKLKNRYKKKKEELEWCDNDYDAGFVKEEMAELKARIKAFRRELESREG